MIKMSINNHHIIKLQIRLENVFSLNQSFFNTTEQPKISMSSKEDHHFFFKMEEIVLLVLT